MLTLVQQSTTTKQMRVTAASNKRMPPHASFTSSLKAHLSLTFKSTPKLQKRKTQRRPPIIVIPTAAASRHLSTHPTSSSSSSSSSVVKHFDFLVIGSGIAGLTYALKVAEYGSVAIITKAAASEGCTRYAQGGICAVLDSNDSVHSHIQDTMEAGAYLNDPAAVEVVCKEGPALVQELASTFGAQFTKTSGGDLHLTREGGHSARRIVHAADATGAEIERALLDTARGSSNIHFYEHHLAVDILIGDGIGMGGQKYALGVDVLDQTALATAPTTCTTSGANTNGHRLMRFLAPVTMLASGGAGQLYPLTTNPGVATGDGMAMAHRVNAAMANLEFVQFHPTALVSTACPFPMVTSNSIDDDDGAICPAFLISEAVRGEGGRLLSGDRRARRFMEGIDPRAELAPRDVVARAIHFEMQAAGTDHVLLDISHLSAEKILNHFPTIAARCGSVGINIVADPIPVAPAQHYMCGGVQTGLYGETGVKGLYACGEVACTGLHGANRLASNSLLEGLVFAHRAVGASVAHAEHALQVTGRSMTGSANSALYQASPSSSSPLRPLPTAARQWAAARRSELQTTMWKAAGIVRRADAMIPALSWMRALQSDVEDLAAVHGPSTQLIELRNLATVGGLVLSSALSRKESRGGHYCLDYPETLPAECRSTIIASPVKKKSTAVSQTLFSSGNSSAAGGSGGSRKVRGELSLTRSVWWEE
jgi:L-aspartate oxidase